MRNCFITCHGIASDVTAILDTLLWLHRSEQLSQWLSQVGRSAKLRFPNVVYLFQREHISEKHMWPLYGLRNIGGLEGLLSCCDGGCEMPFRLEIILRTPSLFLLER